MDSFPLRPNPLHHARSASLPSRSHPLTPQVDEHLCKLYKTASSSLSLIGNKIRILEDMYECLDDFLLLPNTQQAFSKNEKWVEDVLDGYLRLLDLCSTTKDISSQIKGDLQGLNSILRRKRDANELAGYLISRKKTKKAIQKSLKDLKNLKTNHKDNESTSIPSLFKKVETAATIVFESLLSYVSGAKSYSSISSLVTKIIHGKKNSSGNEEGIANGFEKIDVGLKFLINKKTGKFENALSIEKLQAQLTKMELGIHDLEKGLECLFKRLIKTRVSLLNILAH